MNAAAHGSIVFYNKKNRRRYIDMVERILRRTFVRYISTHKYIYTHNILYTEHTRGRVKHISASILYV